MGGSHHDGLAVIGNNLVAAEMTSDDLFVYDLDGSGNAGPEKHYSYTYPAEFVEEMGPGPFDHLWVTGYENVYELGGGEFQEDIGYCGNKRIDTALMEECDVNITDPTDGDNPCLAQGKICNMVPPDPALGGPSACTCTVDPCGNGLTEPPNEDCDTGNGAQDTCAPGFNCNMNAPVPPAVGPARCKCLQLCGNGQPDAGETCDTVDALGNKLDEASCDTNGDVTDNEYCDMLNISEGDRDNDVCSCKLPVCPNGIKDPLEECDPLDPLFGDSYCLTMYGPPKDKCDVNSCSCTSSAPCGDGRYTPGAEECDISLNPGGDVACLGLCFPKNLVDPGDPEQCICGSYSGVFSPQPPELKANEKTFDVKFQDTSHTPLGTKEWTFKLVSIGVGSVCTKINLKDVASGQEINLLANPGDSITSTVGDLMSYSGELTLATNLEDQFCIVTLGAYAPGDTSPRSVMTYVLIYSSKLCPNCVAVEIPAITHPLNTYSGDVGQASAATANADSDVDALDNKCTLLGPSCGNNAGATAKLVEAQNSRKAADSLLSKCTPAEKEVCQMTQYYASMASRLAREGMELLGL